MNINQMLKNEGGSSKYGAQMGRRDWRGDPEAHLKFHLQRLRFVDYCYDVGGAYWGMPANLYCAWDEEAEVRMFVRAKDYAEAKRLTLEAYPKARFFR